MDFSLGETQQAVIEAAAGVLGRRQPQPQPHLQAQPPAPGDDFGNEAARADVPLSGVTLLTVGPALQAHGTSEQKDFFLPRILAGEIHFAIGYTEPEAGTDLASLRTRAVLTEGGGTYLVNGEKIFTTGAHAADYIWLACRTDPGAPKHKGALGRAYASLRLNELLNWQVAATDTVDVADASVTKVYSAEQTQHVGQLLEEVVARHGDPAGEETAELCRWLDIQAKRNTVLTFGGGVNEIQRELIATAGLGLPRVPR